jgi:hypothetical protein
MRRALLSAAFHITLICFLLVLMIPSMIALQVLIPSRPDANGHYRFNGGGFVAMMLALFVNLWIADRLAAALLRFAGVSSDELRRIRKSRRRS